MGRPKIPESERVGETIGIRLPKTIVGKADTIAHLKGITRSDVIREALVAYCNHADGIILQLKAQRKKSICEQMAKLQEEMNNL